MRFLTRGDFSRNRVARDWNGRCFSSARVPETSSPFRPRLYSLRKNIQVYNQ